MANALTNQFWAGMGDCPLLPSCCHTEYPWGQSPLPGSCPADDSNVLGDSPRLPGSCPANDRCLLACRHAAASHAAGPIEGKTARPARPAPGSHGMHLPYAMYGRSPSTPFVRPAAAALCRRPAADSGRVPVHHRDQPRQRPRGRRRESPRQPTQRTPRKVRVAGHVRPE